MGGQVRPAARGVRQRGAECSRRRRQCAVDLGGGDGEDDHSDRRRGSDPEPGAAQGAGEPAQRAASVVVGWWPRQGPRREEHNTGRYQDAAGDEEVCARTVCGIQLDQGEDGAGQGEEAQEINAELGGAHRGHGVSVPPDPQLHDQDDRAAQQDAEPAEEEVSLPAGEVAAQEGDEPGARERHEAGDDRNEGQARPHAQADAGGRGECLVGCRPRALVLTGLAGLRGRPAGGVVRGGVNRPPGARAAPGGGRHGPSIGTGRRAGLKWYRCSRAESRLSTSTAETVSAPPDPASVGPGLGALTRRLRGRAQERSPMYQGSQSYYVTEP